MGRISVLALSVLSMSIGIPSGAAAQEVSDFLSAGEMAPDIQVTGSTRYGVVTETLRLSDFRGETVVLAFFFRARSGG